MPKGTNKHLLTRLVDDLFQDVVAVLDVEL